MDAKHIHQKNNQNGEVLGFATNVALGLTLEGQNKDPRILLLRGLGNTGRLEKLLQGGLRRVLIVIHDDFPGLSGLTSSLFPQADIQLCTVHLLRNARKHLDQKSYRTFRNHFKRIKTSLTYDEGLKHFDSLLKVLPQESSFIAGSIFC